MKKETDEIRTRGPRLTSRLPEVGSSSRLQLA
jgi:hypothetical protein